MDNLTISIKGKDYPLVVSYHVMKTIAVGAKKKKPTDEEYTEDLLWLCLESGCFSNNTKLDITKEQLLKTVSFREFNRVIPLLTDQFKNEKKT